MIRIKQANKDKLGTADYAVLAILLGIFMACFNLLLTETSYKVIHIISARETEEIQQRAIKTQDDKATPILKDIGEKIHAIAAEGEGSLIYRLDNPSKAMVLYLEYALTEGGYSVFTTGNPPALYIQW